jgi:hypothetical protein
MAQNCKHVTINGADLFFSYNTLIGFRADKIADEYARNVFTDERYSVTTSKHRTQFIGKHGGCIVSADEFARLRAKAGI